MITDFAKRNHFAETTKQFAVAVVKGENERELQCFYSLKDAGAWMQHLFGLRPHQDNPDHIKVKSLADRQPQPGDCVIYDNSGPFDTYDKNGGIGVLEHSAGGLMVCFRASTFRDHNTVSCSGGPAVWLKPDSLTWEGLTEHNFWRWHRGYSGGGEGGHYTMTVPLWRWNGQPDND